MAASKHREAFDEFVRRVEEEMSGEVERIILFGSVARGEEREESDVDVLVIVDDADLETKERIVGLAFDVVLETGIYVSAKVVSSEEVERMREMGSPFLGRVEDEGIAAHG